MTDLVNIPERQLSILGVVMKNGQAISVPTYMTQIEIRNAFTTHTDDPRSVAWVELEVTDSAGALAGKCGFAREDVIHWSIGPAGRVQVPTGRRH